MNVSKSGAMGRWTCSAKWPHGHRSQTMISSVRRIYQSVAVCSMLCTDGLWLHLVGKRQPLVYLGSSYGPSKLGDSIWESHHKSSAQGARRANTPPELQESKHKLGKGNSNLLKLQIYSQRCDFIFQP